MDVYSEPIIDILAILEACLSTFAILKSAHYIVKHSGSSGINSISRILILRLKTGAMDGMVYLGTIFVDQAKIKSIFFFFTFTKSK